MNFTKTQFYFLLFIVFLCGSFFYNVYISFENKEINVKSSQVSTNLNQCFTDLEPTSFFNRGTKLLPMGNNSNDFTIHYGNSELQFVTIGYEQDENLKITPSTGRVQCCGSMRPAISDRSLLIIKKPLKNELRVGDIIAFNCTETKSLLHRIIDIDDKGFYLTKGDNNVRNDFDLFNCRPQFSDIRYKVIGVLY